MAQNRDVVMIDLVQMIDKGYQEMSKRNFDDAIHLFNKVIQADPNISTAYLYLGIAYERTGRFSDATNYYCYALDLLRPQDPLAATSVAIVKKYFNSNLDSIQNPQDKELMELRLSTRIERIEGPSASVNHASTTSMVATVLRDRDGFAIPMKAPKSNRNTTQSAKVAAIDGGGRSLPNISCDVVMHYGKPVMGAVEAEVMDEEVVQNRHSRKKQ